MLFKSNVEIHCSWSEEGGGRWGGCEVGRGGGGEVGEGGRPFPQ